MPVVFLASNKPDLSTAHVSFSAYREKGGSPGPPSTAFLAKANTVGAISGPCSIKDSPFGKKV